MVNKNKIESNKNLIYKKTFCFPEFPLFNHLASIHLNLPEKGWTKYFKNSLKSFHISQALICTVYHFWVRTLIQMSSLDRGVAWNKKNAIGGLIWNETSLPDHTKTQLCLIGSIPSTEIKSKSIVLDQIAWLKA